MRTTYTLFHNVSKYRDADNVWGDYRPGASLVRYYQGETEVTSGDRNANDYAPAAWWLFQKHNRDDRPDGRLGPSLSSGDVVVFGDDPEMASACVAVTLTHDGEWEPVPWNQAARDVLPGDYLGWCAAERASR